MNKKRITAAAMAICMALPTAAAASANALDLLKYGDANADGAVNLSDMVTLTNYLHGKKTNIIADLADINRDGSIDSLDLVQLRKKLLAFITSATENSVTSKYATNLTAGLNADEKEQTNGEEKIDDEFRLAHSKFALELMKRQFSDSENVMISPYSIMQAMGMLTNGADGETLTELEEVMGGISVDELNKYLKQWRINQPNEEFCKLTTANSIWARNDENRIKPRPEFLQTTADYYNSEVYVAPFDDTTLEDINAWVNQKTDEMIPKIIDEISPEAIMFLINAVAFDAKWETPYEHEATRIMDFTDYNGNTQTAKMLCGIESHFIHDDHAEGFYKYYNGKKYAFAALLPEEGMTVTEYINSLTPEHFSTLFAEPEAEKVSWEDMTMVRIPKFKYDYQTTLNETLQDMGMEKSFSEYADFTKLTSVGHPSVSEVIHDTFIQLDEGGTKAAAVTAIIMKDTAAIMDAPNELNFDRPFVYAIVDTETDMPVFLGTLTNIPE